MNENKPVKHGALWTVLFAVVYFKKRTCFRTLSFCIYAGIAR